MPSGEVINLYKEHILTQHTSQPLITPKGIAFTVRVDSLDRECLITAEALAKLSALKNIDVTDTNALDVFHAFENRINGVARRLVVARVPGTPLMMTPNTFVNPPQIN